jgi:hypothetical protein
MMDKEWPIAKSLIPQRRHYLQSRGIPAGRWGVQTCHRRESENEIDAHDSSDEYARYTVELRIPLAGLRAPMENGSLKLEGQKCLCWR